MPSGFAFDVATNSHVDQGSAVLGTECLAVKSGWVEAWPEIQRNLWHRSKILLILDYDSLARSEMLNDASRLFPADLEHLLEKLHASSRLAIALISNRSVIDLRSRSTLKDAIYAGNSGAEIEGRGLSCTDEAAMSCRSDLVDVFACLSRYLHRLPGIFVRDNGLSLTVEGGRAGLAEREKAEGLLSALLQKRPRLQLSQESGNWGVRARASWGRDHAVELIRKHLRIIPSSAVYLTGQNSSQLTFGCLEFGYRFAEGIERLQAEKYPLQTRLELMQFLLCILYVVNDVALR